MVFLRSSERDPVFNGVARRSARFIPFPRWALFFQHGPFTSFGRVHANAGVGFKRQGALHFFSLGFGRAYPMQLLSRLIQSSVEPFCRDKLVIDVMIMTYTMSI